ncbi:telomerase component p80-like isoform X2 [Corticium candelabrum]|uniref:telomerase component p80-like isoform X2 n=1 Tax=Corticium candelabrum TaxID=121492 RepID=UPI002E266843|nr:telomerase component p80-like isoform X2 [Corticium candelabrum]
MATAAVNTFDSSVEIVNEECLSLQAILGADILLCTVEPVGVHIVVHVKAEMLDVHLLLGLDEQALSLYPDQVIPTIAIQATAQSLSQESVSSIETSLSQLANELLGQPMLFQLIEHCRERLLDLAEATASQNDKTMQTDTQTGEQLQLNSFSGRQTEERQDEILYKVECNAESGDNVEAGQKFGIFGDSAPSLSCDKIQARELAVVKSTYKSFKMLESALEHKFEVTLAATPYVLTNKIAACLLFVMPPDYPYDSLQVAVTIVKGKKKGWQRVALQRYLNKVASQARGRTCTGEIIKCAKSWLQHRNAALLIEDGLGYYAPASAKPPPTVVTELDAFELRGKMLLVNLTCATMLSKIDYLNEWDERKLRIIDSAWEVAYSDPEFILKLAYHIRNELNIRSTANFLLAMACAFPITKPFIRSYFCAIVRLPSDLLDVVRTYKRLPLGRLTDHHSLPNCLRAAVCRKFQEFDEYQLAKYCSEGNRKRTLMKRAKTSRYFAAMLQRRVDKIVKSRKMELFARLPYLTMKHIIRQVHIHEPRELVMKVLGLKYPKSEDEFSKSGLTGEWDMTRAGKRMKLVTPYTWEAVLSRDGNTAESWEKLIESGRLPFMAMVRNIRNFLRAGVSPKHHRMVRDRLNDTNQVVRCRMFPIQFVSVYDAVAVNLKTLSRLHKIYCQLQKKEKARKRNDKSLYQRGVIDDAGIKKRLLSRKKRVRKQIQTRTGRSQIVLPKHMPNPKLLQEYREALNLCIVCAANHNVQRIERKTIIFCDVSHSMCKRWSSYPTKSTARRLYEAALLIALMVHRASVECDIWLFSETSVRLQIDSSLGPLENLKIIEKKYWVCLRCNQAVAVLWE